MPKIKSALVAYSILKDQLERADLYEGLMFFFKPITAQLAHQTFIPSELSNLLADSYGLNVPALVIESLAERMANSGLLYKYAGNGSAASYRYAESDTATTSLSLPLINELLDDFKSFARKQSKEFKKLNDESLEQSFFDRLINIETLEIFSRKDGLIPQKRTAKTITQAKQEPVNHHSNIETHLDYVVSSYIIELKNLDDQKFQFLADVASANLAAETLLTYRDPPKKGEAFDELEIYLDAPIVLDILGVNIGREEFGREFVSELKRANCKVNIFLHSIIEIERILESRKQSYLTGISYVGKPQVDPPRIQAVVNSLAGHSEQILTTQLGFYIVDSAEAIPVNRRMSVGVEHEKSIREQLVNWASDEGREVDVKTCCDLIRLRSAMELQTRIITSGVILVSKNAVLASAANKAWKSWLSDRKAGSMDRIKKAASLVISEKHLLGLIWITQGGDVGKLARAHLIANCSAAISTKRDIISKVYNLLVDISPQAADTFEAVINDQRAERALMNFTFGDPDLVTSEVVFPLLEKIKLETASEVADLKNKEIEDLTIQLNQEKERNKNSTAQLALERDNAVLQSTNFQNRLTEIDNAEKIRSLELLKKCFKRASNIYILITFMIVISISVTMYLLTGLIQYPEVKTFYTELVRGVVAAVSGIFFAWNMPDILFGPLRKSLANSFFYYQARKYSVQHLLEEYQPDFQSNKLIDV